MTPQSSEQAGDLCRGENAAINGYVLAGGASSRFGSDKALARFGSQTILDRMCDMVRGVAGAVTVVAPPNRYSLPQIKFLDDRWPGEGPLGGVLAALHASAAGEPSCPWNLIVSCDMPFLTRQWLGHMKTFVIPSEARNLSGAFSAIAADTEVVVPRSEHGLEPLCACWRTSALAKLQEAFDEGVRKVTEAMKRLRMEVLDEAHWKRFDTAGRLFWNMNTQQDYEDALRVWDTEKA